MTLADMVALADAGTGLRALCKSWSAICLSTQRFRASSNYAKSIALTGSSCSKLYLFGTVSKKTVRNRPLDDEPIGPNRWRGMSEEGPGTWSVARILKQSV